MRVLANWIVSALSLYIVSRIIPGIIIENFSSALVAIVMIGLVNALIKPILFILTLPVTIVTLGLFTLVINALMLLLASTLTPGFTVNGLIPALIGSIMLSIVTTFFQAFTK